MWDLHNVNRSEYTPQKSWKYRSIEKQILSQLTDALILHKMKTGHKGNYDVAPLTFDKDWSIVIKEKHTTKKWPVDVLGAIEKINILKTKDDLFATIQNSDLIAEEDKVNYYGAISNFVNTHFFHKRGQLEKKATPHVKFRRYYTKLAAEKGLSPEKQKLYRDICLTLANMLYEKNPSFLDQATGQINQLGLKHLATVFLKTVKNLLHSGASKSFHKIFHDGDFSFLRKENAEGKPLVGTLDHYVQVILYLMDYHGFNAYAEWGEEWAKEWAKSKKSFLNNLFATAYLEEEQHQEKLSDKKNAHKIFAHHWKSSLDSTDKNWNMVDRFKTEASMMLKIGGRTKNIQDESGLRANYYGPMHDQKYIENSILQISKDYFKQIKEIPGLSIESIQSDRKGNFLSAGNEEFLLKELGAQVACENISKRMKSNARAASPLESLSDKYQTYEGKKPTPGLKRAYQIANGEVSRGANGDYKDFKFLVKYHIDHKTYNTKLKPGEQKLEKDLDLCQEISFYPNSNELNMGNHHFLDLEKRIFNRVKNTNDKELGKSISLNRLRYFTETALKDISFDIDCYEAQVAAGKLPHPENDDYKYLVIDGNRFSLKDLIYRHEENSDRFDTLITHILNYFITQNKILYLNKSHTTHYGLITPDLLRDRNTFKQRRFLTSDVLRHTAQDQKRVGESICFYTDKKTYIYPNFYAVSLEDLGDFISLEQDS